MTFSGCDTSPTVDCCSFSICRTQSQEELGRVGERSLGWTARLSCGDTDFFFFFNAYAEERTRKGGRQNSPLASQWLHPPRCMQKRDSMSVPRDTQHAQKCEQEDWAVVSGSERIAPYRLDQSSLESKRTPRDFPRRLFLYPLPSAAARTAPNGVKERASFCLVFRSLNTTSSHRMFSMGYRRAEGNTNFQKRIFWQTTSGALPAGFKPDFPSITSDVIRTIALPLTTGSVKIAFREFCCKKKTWCWLATQELESAASELRNRRSNRQNWF